MARLRLESVHAALGARFADDLGVRLPARYGEACEERIVRESAGLIDRSHRGVLDLSGPSLPKTLDGLFTSAVSRLAPGRGERSLFLTPRGKIVGAFHVYHLPDGRFRLLFSEPIPGPFVPTLSKYAFLSDVVLADRSAEIGTLSIEGPAAREILERLAGASELPAEPGLLGALPLGGADVGIVRGGESPEGGFDLWVPSEALETVWTLALREIRARGGGPVGHEAAEVLRLEAGIPRFGKDFDGESFPGEAGWEGALTFHKCYIGQEVMARIRTYGHVNRKLRSLTCDAPAVLPPGTPIRVKGEDAGALTSAARSMRLGAVVGLASIRREFWETDEAEAAFGAESLRVRLLDSPPA